MEEEEEEDIIMKQGEEEAVLEVQGGGIMQEEEDNCEVGGKGEEKRQKEILKHSEGRYRRGRTDNKGQE